MTPWTLDAKLNSDSHFICRWELCELRWMNNRHFPWLILIPQTPGVTEIYQLSSETQIKLMQEITQASQTLQSITQCDKLNLASFGNIVPQLHIHLIARFYQDPIWPKPVFNTLNEPYTPEELNHWLQRLRPLQDLAP